MKRTKLRLLATLGIALCAALHGHDSSAQEIEAPDYTAIRQSISNSKSPNYYPHLVARYLANDTTLSLEQYRNLYYGFTLQEDFVPYQHERRSLFDIRHKLATSGADVALCPEAIRVAQGMLDDNPFDILAISTMSIAHLQLGDTVAYRAWDSKQKGLLDAILSSGDGDSPTTAFHVISLEHEYEVLARMGLEVASDSLCTDQIEYLRVKTNADDERGFYFNFGACSRIYKMKYE